MAYKYFLTLETPSKKNSRVINTKTGRSFPNKKYTDWHECAEFLLISQQKPRKPIDYPVIIKFVFIHGDRIKRDSDNQVSSILDLFQDAGILAGDNWEIVREYTVKNGYEKKKPSCYVEISRLEDKI